MTIMDTVLHTPNPHNIYHSTNVVTDPESFVTIDDNIETIPLLPFRFDSLFPTLSGTYSTPTLTGLYYITFK